MAKRKTKGDILNENSLLVHTPRGPVAIPGKVIVFDMGRTFLRGLGYTGEILLFSEEIKKHGGSVKV